MARTIPRRKGRPSREARIVATQRIKPVVRPAEGVRFQFPRSDDQPADVAHYWTRRAFYEALSAYAPAAHDELAQVAQDTRASEPFPFTLTRTLRRWCAKYHVQIALAIDPPDNDDSGHSRGSDGQVPEWLLRDAIDSFGKWDWQGGEPFHLRAFYRGGRQPEIDPRMPRLDSVECRAFLRFDWVRFRIDEAGATVPEAVSKSAIIADLVSRFRDFLDLEFDDALSCAESLGLTQPSLARLETAMRRYTLKQFRWLDSLDIAAAEARGDPSVDIEPTEEDRQVIRDFLTQRRDVDDDIKFAADKLGIPARVFPAGRKPTRSLAARRS
jgi:hypothetical protein